VDVDAELRLERDGTEFGVWTEGDLLVVAAPSLRALGDLASLERLVPADALATRVGGVELRVRRATVARIGDGPPSRVARRLFGLDARVRWPGVAVAAVRALG
jgi:hypothetical protein